jgi:hypothetical protein
LAYYLPQILKAIGSAADLHSREVMAAVRIVFPRIEGGRPRLDRSAATFGIDCGDRRAFALVNTTRDRDRDFAGLMKCITPKPYPTPRRGIGGEVDMRIPGGLEVVGSNSIVIPCESNYSK